MKKILLSALFLFGLSQAQVVKTSAGLIHQTIVYTTATNVVTALDTTGTGVQIPGITLHTPSDTGYVKTDLLNVGNGATILGFNGSASFAGGAVNISSTGKINSSDSIVGVKIRAGSIQNTGITSAFFVGTNAQGLEVKTPTVGSVDTACTIDCVRGIAAGDSSGSLTVNNISTKLQEAALLNNQMNYVFGTVPVWDAGTTYAANVFVVYNGQVFVSNSAGNIGNLPSVTGWTNYGIFDLLTYILNNAVFH